MIEVKVCKDEQSIEAARIAIDATLYVPGWSLHERLRRVIVGQTEAVIALAYKNDVPVAVVMIRLMDGFTVAFCRKSERGQGIASRCIAKLRASGYTPTFAFEGIEGSETFWRKQNITMNRPY